MTTTIISTPCLMNFIQDNQRHIENPFFHIASLPPFIINLAPKHYVEYASRQAEDQFLYQFILSPVDKLIETYPADINRTERLSLAERFLTAYMHYNSHSIDRSFIISRASDFLIVGDGLPIIWIFKYSTLPPLLD
jgi:hypothetical protein